MVTFYKLIGDTPLVSVRYTKVVDPSLHIFPHFKQLITHTHAPISVRQSPYLLFENVQSVCMPLDLSAVKGKTKELALSDLNHLAFLLINKYSELVKRPIALFIVLDNG